MVFENYHEVSLLPSVSARARQLSEISGSFAIVKDIKNKGECFGGILQYDTLTPDFVYLNNPSCLNSDAEKLTFKISNLERVLVKNH